MRVRPGKGQTVRDPLAAVTQVWQERGTSRTGADTAYLVYLIVLTAAVLGIPGLIAAGELLARPDVLPLLRADAAPAAVSALSLFAAGALVLLGGVRGPALLPPFFTATLAASGLRRSRVLRRPFLRSLLGLVLLTILPAALVGATLLTVGDTDPRGVALTVLAAAGCGLLLGAAWLLGQVLQDRTRRRLALGLVFLAAAATLLPVPVGPSAVMPTAVTSTAATSTAVATSASAAGWALALAGAGLLTAAACLPLLNRLRGAVLAEQAARWEAATVTATSMDVAGAAGALRPPPGVGRKLPAVGGGSLLLLYARRDAIAWLRSPERSLAGAAGALLGAAALAAAALITGPAMWTLLLVGAVLLWVASGALVDGQRHAVHTLGAPQLFGQRPERQLLLHTIAPVAGLALLALLGGGAVALWSGGGAGRGAVEGAGTAGMLVPPVLLAAVCAVGRARDAAKGRMPLALATPMPTPQGDLSVLTMAAWHSDALLLALGAAVLLHAVAPLGAGALLIAGAVCGGLLALDTLRRLRALESR